MEISDDSAPKTISLDALYCEGAQGKFPDVPQSGVFSVRRPCIEVYDEGVLSCKHPDWEGFVTEAKGFDLGNKQVRGIKLSLPRYILIPDRDSTELPLHLDAYGTLGVRPKDIFPNATHHRNGVLQYKDLPRLDTTYTARNIFAGKQTIFFHTGPDVFVEGLNRDKDEINLYPNLGTMGLAAMVSPDFSVNAGDCYPGQLVNLNRGLAMAERGEASGVPSIPNVFAVDDYQRQMWVDYINPRPSIGVVSINCQLQHSSYKDIAIVHATVLYLLKHVGHELHIILRGFPFTMWALTPLAPYGAQLHFADSAPFMLAKNNGYTVFNRAKGKLIRVNEKPRTPVDRTRMIEAGITSREEFLDFAFATHAKSPITAYPLSRVNYQ